MEERRIAPPFVTPASLIISTISKPNLFNGSLAKNFFFFSTYGGEFLEAKV
jgi:hypothetical protein